MSEYQYYEFQTIDRQLTDRQMRELRAISSRATISRTRFSNDYTYGDLKANPRDLLVQYFDASLSFAHWFYVELAFRFPKTAVAMRRLRRYAAGQSLDVHSTGVHQSLKRLERSRLVDAQSGRPILRAVEEFLIYGVKYAFPARRGEATRGIPTGYAAAPLNQEIRESGELPPVWPDPQGDVRGLTLEPLHKSAPRAVANDPRLYELLALIDALRDGRARERQTAERELAARLRKLLRG